MALSPAIKLQFDIGSITALSNWKPNQTDSKDEIRAFDLHGKLLAHFGVLGLVPEATSVSVWDVAVNPGKTIGVAAVYAKPGSAQNCLLFLDFDGKLKSTFALSPSRGIARMAFDDQSNLWTLTESAGDQSPDGVPMVVEYSSTGKQLRTLLTRSAFPGYEQIIRVTPTSGYPNLGYDSGVFWFWLPATGELVTVQTDSGQVERTKTGLPALGEKIYPTTLYRVSANQYLLGTLNRGGEARVQPLYLWSAQSAQWAPFDASSECGSSHLLFGTLAHQPVFVGATGYDLCAAGTAAQ